MSTGKRRLLDRLTPECVGALDVDGMLGAIEGLPEQLVAGYEAARRVFAEPAARASLPERPSGFVVCGMGGSAIGADLALAALPGLSVPSAVVRGYELPVWVGAGALVVAVSYSGDTEETLACAREAASRGCSLFCISSGGELARFAAATGSVFLQVPGGGQPRAAVGSLTAPIFALLQAGGFVRFNEDDLSEAVGLLREGNALYGPSPDEDNPAKALACALFRRQALVYGAGATIPVARRWKGQLNENAKVPAFCNELPELDHNELMGWTSLPELSAQTVAVFLDTAEDARLACRATLTADELAACGLAVEMVEARGSSQLARLFSLVQLGDYLSLYLAVLYGVDPTPVEAIQRLKRSLAAADG